MKKVSIGILCLSVLLGLGWVFTANDTAMNKVFMPANEQIRRNTFEQSKAYRQGTIQELQNMQFEYLQADSAHKAALASIIRHRSADFPSDELPPDLYNFIEGLPQ